MKTPTPKVRAGTTPTPSTTPPKRTVADIAAGEKAEFARQEANRIARQHIRPGVIVEDQGRIGVVIMSQPDGQLLILKADGMIYSQDISMLGRNSVVAIGSPLDRIADQIGELLAPLIGVEQAAPKDAPLRAKLATAMDAIGIAASAVSDAQEIHPDGYADAAELNRVWEALAAQYRAMGALVTDSLMHNTDGDCVVDQSASGLLAGVRPIRGRWTRWAGACRQ